MTSGECARADGDGTLLSVHGELDAMAVVLDISDAVGEKESKKHGRVRKAVLISAAVLCLLLLALPSAPTDADVLARGGGISWIPCEWGVSGSGWGVSEA
uniref:Uncharacterized protein n=1 Tax=Calcidiscus leptoporus TaxID=127549 RepID=A0A7S0JC63_9EUKA|mmetsp:Transcript_49771/g.114903  ORF Transcript_49771/g.114903 Transcript_49771/m.114903 type:complete len:100 (+) Transcript_49771:142-441(+)